jgi:hypothetical protein
MNPATTSDKNESKQSGTVQTTTLQQQPQHSQKYPGEHWTEPESIGFEFQPIVRIVDNHPQECQIDDIGGLSMNEILGLLEY